MQIEKRNLDTLVIHAAIKNQPKLSEDELLEWRKGLKARGEDRVPPISITKENEIVDGRHRFWCAQKLGWKTIPVEVVGEDEVNAIVVQSLTNRRSYTKSQLAYILAPFVDPELNTIRMLAGGVDPAKAVRRGGMFATEELAALIKTSSRIVQQALEIRELFNTDKQKRNMKDRNDVTEKNVTIKEFFEKRILLAEDPEVSESKPYGLGAVLAGIKAIQKMEGKETPHGGGRPKAVEQQLSLFTESVQGLKSRFVYWEKWEPETRQVALNSLPPVVENMPDDLLTEFSKIIKTEQARRKK